MAGGGAGKAGIGAPVRVVTQPLASALRFGNPGDPIAIDDRQAHQLAGQLRQVSRAAARKAVDELQAKGMQFNELAHIRK